MHSHKKKQNVVEKTCTHRQCQTYDCLEVSEMFKRDGALRVLVLRRGPSARLDVLVVRVVWEELSEEQISGMNGRRKRRLRQ